MTHRPKVDNLSTQLKIAHRMMMKAEALPIVLASDPSKNDIYLLSNEPNNRMSNVLEEGESHYRNKQPTFIFDLYNGENCYISEVIVDPSEPAPGDTEIFVSDNSKEWKKVEYNSTKDLKRHYLLIGEQYGKYLKIHFLNNERKGYFVGIRRIQVKGSKQTSTMYK